MPDDVDERLTGIRTDGPVVGPDKPALERAVERVRRATARRRRGDTFLIVAGLLIAGIVIAGVSVLAINLASGSDDTPAAVEAPRRTPTPARAVAPTTTPAPTRTPFSFGTAPPNVREDCDAIRGTDYQSDAERVYFQQNCLTEQDPVDGDEPPPVVGAPFVPPPGQPTPVPGAPTAPPTPVPAVSDISRAIGLAIDWLATGGAESYTASPGSCTAVQSSGHWVVTCNAQVAGCQGAVCDRVVSVCVLNDLATVRPSNQC